MYSTIITLIILAVLSWQPVQANVLSEDTTWQGEITLEEDVIVSSGVTLTVSPGARITVHPSGSTKIDPEYMSHQTEILVRGKLIAQGTAENRIVFEKPAATGDERWAGLIVDHGEVMIENATIAGAEAAISVLSGQASLDNSLVTENRYGLVGQGKDSSFKLQNVKIEKNDYGVMIYNSAGLEKDQQTIIKENAKNDLFTSSTTTIAVTPREYTSDQTATPVVYRDEALSGLTVWKGKILIDGQLRLPMDARLIILPGTVIEFTKRDTNNDGIGENGLQVQGQLIAKGTPEKPILFRSGEPDRQRGNWDAINILGSDMSQNIIEYCQIENAYRGMHFHYSNVVVNNTILKNNYRGIQFQESLVSLNNNQIYNNKSGIQCRDSELVFKNNEIFNNLNGANFFRLSLTAADNIFANNSWDGLRLREGTSTVSGNLMAGNRTGFLVADAVYGNFGANILSGNLESGLLVRNTDNVEITDNGIISNGLTGISLRDTRATIRSNLIVKNGERGIGIISFTGLITANNIANNGLYAIGLEGADDIDASGNWWGDSDLDREIYDINDEPGLGKVNYAPQLAAPVTFTWPLPAIISDIIWDGELLVDSFLEVVPAASLTLLPGTKIRFGEEAGLMVNGRLHAVGTPDRRITFTSVREEGPGDWQGVRLERATGSKVQYSDFSYADWGLHVHFLPMEITNCRFTNNDIGMKFRSGPITLSRSLFRNNRIGVRSFLGNMDLVDNEISGNEIGIFVREGGKGIRIHHNNIRDNDRYNLRLGDFDKDDVDATGNWWGIKDPGEKIFDKRMESYIGRALVEPVLEKPVELDLDNPQGGTN